MRCVDTVALAEGKVVECGEIGMGLFGVKLGFG